MDRVPGRAISNTALPVGSTQNNPLLVDENGHFGLTSASTADNPFLVDKNGNFATGRSPVKSPPRRLQIYAGPPSAIVPRIRGRGPPSMIRQDTPRIRVARAAREEANDRPYLRALARVSLPPTLASAASPPVAGSSTSAAAAASGSNRRVRKDQKKPRVGFRRVRTTPLTVNELYLTAARPPADSDPLPHHECSVCFNVKSHPVAYRCGHSNCYVCVRQWLEHGWTCPVCRATITEEPILNGDSERAIAFDHPTWHDHSLNLATNNDRELVQKVAILDQIKKPVRDFTLYSSLLGTIMPRGRPRLDAETKAARRKDSLRRYAAKLREESEMTSDQRLRIKASAAKYRERKRKDIRQAAKLRRAESYINDNSLEAFEEQQQRGHMAKTQKLHEGRPTPARPRPALRKRFDPAEILTDNQIRCRALRSCGLEEDNGDDSDEGLPRGICGCDRTECQLMHKNEMADRKDWKLFHLKYRQELENGF
ncbi:hypothetical protein DFH06DRAFT_1340672 [Mycena polygramma]|nr:hypothetical protein DFH06DRAFT_1340672 [Mycena polygramma]